MNYLYASDACFLFDPAQRHHASTVPIYISASTKTPLSFTGDGGDRSYACPDHCVHAYLPGAKEKMGEEINGMGATARRHSAAPYLL